VDGHKGTLRGHPVVGWAGSDWAKACCQDDLLAWGWVQEVLVAYNRSPTEARKDYVIVDSTLHQEGEMMKFLYGKAGFVTVQSHPASSLFVQLELAPMQFGILQ
jgi:hypothetical protein